MTFKQWFEKTENLKWHEDYKEMMRFYAEKRNSYTVWCNEQKIVPVFDV